MRTLAVVNLLRTRLQHLMLKQSRKLPICFNIPVYSAKIMAIFRGIFEATQFQSNLLQQNSKNVEAIFPYGQLLQQMVKYGCKNRTFRDRV